MMQIVEFPVMGKGPVLDRTPPKRLYVFFDRAGRPFDCMAAATLEDACAVADILGNVEDIVELSGMAAAAVDGVFRVGGDLAPCVFRDGTVNALGCYIELIGRVPKELPPLPPPTGDPERDVLGIVAAKTGNWPSSPFFRSGEER